MKRILLFTLLSLLVLSLAACGQDNPADACAAGHTYGTPTTVKSATCEEKGTVSRTCAVCGHIATEEAALIPHSYENDICTMCGIYADTSLSFELNADGASYSVRKYSGTATAVTVPATYRGKPVTAIGRQAFYDCRQLSAIHLPDTVAKIGESAFENCEALTAITLPVGVTEIGRKAFSSCSALASVLIPEGVTAIPEECFVLCSSLEEITLPSTVKEIGRQAFYFCHALKRVTADGALDAVGERAFRECPALLEFAAGGTPAIGAEAFYECKKLLTLDVPDGLSAIGQNAFKSCLRLHEVVLAPTLSEIGGSAFEGCLHLALVTNLSTLPVTSGASNYGGLARYAFAVLQSKDPDLTNGIALLRVGDFFFITVTEIPDNDPSAATVQATLFDYVGEDVTPEIPTLVSDAYTLTHYRILRNAFYKSPIVFADIPEGVTEIEDEAFYLCEDLLSIIIPDTVERVSPSLFFDCDRVAEVINRTGVDLGALEGREGMLIFYQDPLDPRDVPNASAIKNADGVLYWDDRTTVDGKHLRYILGYIGEENVRIALPALPAGETYGKYAICASAFLKVKSAGFAIPHGVTEIGQEAFCGATLGDLVIPDSVTHIYASAFANATFTSLIVPDTAYADEILGYRSSTRHHYDEDGYIRLGSLLVFASTDLSGDVVLDATIKNIGFRAFHGCSRITSLTLADGTLTISAAAFMDCTSLTTITIPKSVVNLRANILRGCSSLTLIEYSGTTAEWRALTEGIMLSQVSSLTAGVTVRCSDGTLTLDVYGQVVE